MEVYTTTKEETIYGVPDAGEESQPVRGFTKITNAVIRDSSVSRNARLTYIILESYAWEEQGKKRDYCFPGQETLAEHLGCCDRQVRTYLAELQGAGWIDKQHRPLDNGKNRTDRYTLHRTVEGSTFTTDRKYTSAPDRNRTSTEEHKAEKLKVSSLRGAAAPQGKEQEEQGMVVGRKSAPTTSFPDQPTERQIPASPELARKEKVSTGKDFATLLQARLTAARMDPPSNLGKYGAIFRDMDRGDVTAEQIVDHIVARWPAKHLLPNDALQEIVAERKPAANGSSKGTPATGVEAIRNYVSKRTGSTHLRQLAPLAEQFDFTGDADPPPRIFRQLGGATPNTWGKFADDERRRNLELLRSVCKRAVREAEADKGNRTRSAMMAPWPTSDKPASGPRINSDGPEAGPEGSTTPEPQEEPTTKEVSV